MLADAPRPALVVIATGSEVALAMSLRMQLHERGIAARVVSMPCTAAFDRQPADYRAAVLPPDVPRLVIEAAQPDGWWRYLAGVRGDVVGIARFGESAPAAELLERFGFTPQAVLDRALALLAQA